MPLLSSSVLTLLSCHEGGTHFYLTYWKRESSLFFKQHKQSITNSSETTMGSHIVQSSHFYHDARTFMSKSIFSSHFHFYHLCKNFYVKKHFQVLPWVGGLVSNSQLLSTSLKVHRDPSWEEAKSIQPLAEAKLLGA